MAQLFPGLTFDNGGLAPNNLQGLQFGDPNNPNNANALNLNKAVNSGGLTFNSGPSVLGASTQAPAPQNNNSGSNFSLRDQMTRGLIPWDDNLLNSGGNGGQPSDPYASLKNDISSSWDNYLNSLQGQEGYLNESRTAQEGVAKNALTLGTDTINANKAASLKDIANTTRNAFQAGNNYLGSMGAGDSSAASQYSFAINQQANKQTGDLNNFVNTQMSQLKNTYDTQVQQIAQWFSQQQQTLKQQIAEGGLKKGQDLANLSKGILDQAMQATQQAKTTSQNQYNALVEWASTNSQNVGQLGQNIAAIGSQFAPGQVQGIGSSNSQPIFGGGPLDKTKQGLF